MLHFLESVNRTIYLCAQTVGLRRMLYMHRFYAVKKLVPSIHVALGGGGVGLQLREKLPKEIVSMYYNSDAKLGLRLKEKVKKECVSRNYQRISEELTVVYPQVLCSKKSSPCYIRHFFVTPFEYNLIFVALFIYTFLKPTFSPS